MSSNQFSTDRQTSIREHLAKSSGGEVDFQRSPQNYDPNEKSFSLSNRQKSRKEHIERSKGNYDLSFGSKQDRKSRIMSHIKITRG